LSPLRDRNLLLFTTVNSIWSIVTGFIGPFYVVQVERLSGGMEKLGIAFSIMVLIQSVTTYFIGHFSDKMGRKPFLFLCAYADATVLFFYTIIHETYQLYILQALLGITNGISGTISTSFLADLTTKEGRGRTVGAFNAVVSLAAAGGLFMSGYMVKTYGLKYLFYLASASVALSTVFLFFIKEDVLGKAEGVPAQGLH
jgi:MFS transporter, DHA1 family, multidrug resistance protein